MVTGGGGGVVEEPKSSQQQPCLLITDGRGENFGIETNMFNNKPQLVYDVGGEIPEFVGRRIGCSFGEWVLLTGGGHNLPEVLVNLLSKEITELPLLGITYDFCILTSHPCDPNCHIVYFSKEENALIFCQPGDKEFTIQKWDHKFFPRGSLEEVVGVAGKLFVTISRLFFTVGVIEFKESTYQLQAIRVGMDGRETTPYVYFEYSGELFAIYRTTCGVYLTGFEILKVDLLNKKVVSVKKLLGRTHAIFIGYGTAHVQCASVESGIKANSIYFFQPHDLDNYYIYNLEDGSIRMKPSIGTSSMEMGKGKDTQLDWLMMPCEASFRRLLKESICHDSEKASGEVEEEVGVQTSSWNTVPPELLDLIQLHLFARDHAVFRVVCKGWQQVSIPALLPWTTTLLELCQSSSPLFMFQEDIYDSAPIFRFLDPVHKKLYRTRIPELRESEIQYSKDGWLLVTRRCDDSIFFFNPLTQEKIELPRMPFHSAHFALAGHSLSFSSLPTSSDCLVVGIAYYRRFITLKHGEETWTLQLRRRDEFWVEYARCPVVLNGLHHFMVHGSRDMVVYNLNVGVEFGKGLDFQILSSKFKRSLHGEDFFLEIDGALAFVSVEADGRELSIFKWNDLKMDWEDGVDFGGKGMFLSRRVSFMDDVGGGAGMGNTIFLPMIDDTNQGVFYSLATHRYHTLYSGYSSEQPYHVDKFLNGIWIKPDRKIVSDSNLKWFM